METYIRDTHDEIMISNVCGNDQWMDNHYAYDADDDAIPNVYDRYDMSNYADHADALGLPYHWWNTGRDMN